MNTLLESQLSSSQVTPGGAILLLAVIFIASLVVAVAFVSMRTTQAQGPRVKAIVFATAISLWLITTAILAELGSLAQWYAFPPRIPLLLLGAIGIYATVWRLRTTGLVLASVPFWLPVLLQSFRMLVEMALWQLHREGSVPVQFTFEGRNLDVLTGLTAILVAWGIAAGRLGPRSVLLWNVAGLGLLLNAIAIAATSSPGPQHLDWPGQPFTAIATWPLIWLPTFLAPTAIFLHLISTHQCFSMIYRDSEGTHSTDKEAQKLGSRHQPS